MLSCTELQTLIENEHDICFISCEIRLTFREDAMYIQIHSKKDIHYQQSGSVTLRVNLPVQQC